MDVKIINGAHIAYRYRPGSGRTIVFANFLGGDQSVWDDVIAALPKTYGVLTYDLPGHGLSGGLTDSIEGLADDLSQLIDALGLRDVLFCGVSIGGMIGQVLTAKRPDVVRGAVLCNTAVQIGTTERWIDRIAAVEENGIADIAPMVVNTWFGPDYATRADRMALHQAMAARTTDEGYKAACVAIRDADIGAFAPTITVPVLCVGGTDDGTVSPAQVEALAQAIPGAKVTILEKLGHLPCVEMPAELATLIVGFS